MANELPKTSQLSPKILVIIFIILILESILLWNSSSQGSTFIYPYFSGATNLNLNLNWRIDADAYSTFANLSYSEQLHFVFQPSQAESLIEYSSLDKGYMFIVWIAENLFFWLPQIKAVIWLQILFHISSSLWVINKLKTKHEQVIFFLFYAANPIVIHFVTFAFYYYWQIIPPLAWFIYKEINKSNKLIPIIFFAVILWIAFLIRQSTLIISILLLCTIAWQTRKFSSLLVILIFLFFSIASKNSSQPWHTAFVGIGAYPNSLEIKLSDQSGYNYYFEKTGVKIKLDEPYDNLYDKNVRNEYYSTLKNAFMDYVRKYPLEIFRNASLNILQSFSIGYLVKYPELNYLSALFGLVILILLFKKHMYFLSILIITNVAGFIFYFPPIPAYMFSNYFLLTLALLAIVKQRMY